MNNLDNFLSLIKATYFLKIGFLSIDFIFILFLIVLTKQVFSMNHIVNDTNDSGVIKSGAVFLLILAISLFLIGIVIL